MELDAFVKEIEKSRKAIEKKRNEGQRLQNEADADERALDARLEKLGAKFAQFSSKPRPERVLSVLNGTLKSVKEIAEETHLTEAEVSEALNQLGHKVRKQATPSSGTRYRLRNPLQQRRGMAADTLALIASEPRQDFVYYVHKLAKKFKTSASSVSSQMHRLIREGALVKTDGKLSVAPPQN